MCQSGAGLCKMRRLLCHPQADLCEATMIDPAASPLAFFVSEMTRMRTGAGLSQPALAKRLSYSASQIAKIETCQRIPKAELAHKLDEVFGTDGLFARLQPLVERSSVLPWFRDLFDLEGTASQIRTYESYLIPGILQTEAYAQASVEAARPVLTPEEVEQAVALRMTRQEILERQDAPHLWAIIDESVLYREVGSPAVMRQQCKHLLKMGQWSNVVIQIIRSADGICCAFGRAFMLLSFRNQGDLVYMEDIGSARYLRDRDEVAKYSLAFDHLRGSALADDKSAALFEVLLHDK
jgi:transcriptional regulator with XRE-family HTH domain